MTNYVIVGMGVAGIGAAEAIRSVDKSSLITFIGDDPHGFYSRPGLAYYLTGEVDEKLLFPFQPQDLKDLDAHFTRGTVVRIHPQLRQVELSDGKRVSYDRLLLAVGSSAIRLNIPGANLEGVVKLDHLEDARRIVSLAKRARTAVVVGGGITALELAEGLASRKVKVHLLIRTAHYWSNVLDDIESEIVEQRLKEDGVTIHFVSELTDILGKNGRVAGFRLASGQQFACDMLAYGVGVKPRLTLARDAGIDCDRGVLVDEHLRTNLDDIYAAGDVAQVYDPASGRSVLDSLWSPAREQGRVAGMNMAGRIMAYLKPVPFNVTRLAGLTTTIIGMVGSGQDGEPFTIARGDSETWRDMPDAIVAQSGFDVNHLRLMVGNETIVGAIVMGDQKLSSALQVIIRDQVNITPIREQLIAPNAPIADIMAHFWAGVHASRN
ncbi:MAG: FAD-dependent oxidoreductase [Chloroflexi bacterium]|nr:FAD-dependent oxidoreductase [Chloroflexota bacterium]